jgi:hypothetical protein
MGRKTALKQKGHNKMKKAEALKEWKNLEPAQNILKHFTPISPKARGSRYGACGIRIDGNPEFVKAVMSRLKDLIDGENHVTRLGLAWNIVDGSGIGKSLDNAETNAECCYIRLYMRGSEGTIASGIFDRHLDESMTRFEKAIA